MNGYLKTENASITVEYSNDILVTLFKDSKIYNRGFQRLFIECKASKLIDVYKELKNLELEFIEMMQNFGNNPEIAQTIKSYFDKIKNEN